MNKDELEKELIEARGYREYYRVKHSRSWFKRSIYEADYMEWDERVRTIEILLGHPERK